MKNVINFEGFYSSKPNHNLEHAIFMVKPTILFVESQNLGGIDILVEDYFMDLFENVKLEKPKFTGEEIIEINKIFNNLKNSQEEKYIYWNQTFEYSENSFSSLNLINKNQLPCHKGHDVNGDI